MHLPMIWEVHLLLIWKMRPFLKESATYEIKDAACSARVGTEQAAG